MASRLETEVRYLKMYAVLSTLVLAFLVISQFRVPSRPKVLDVERLNIVSPDGKLALALAGRGRLPGPMMDGKTFPAELSQGRTTSAGMIFFNESGDEVGGLTLTGSKTDSGYQAVGHLSFDQWKQDQVVALQYIDENGRRRAGLNVWDRATDAPLSDVIGLLTALRTAQGKTRDSLQQVMNRLREQGKFGTHRLFLGSANGNAMLQIEDTKGRVRARLVVDSTDTARLEFLDAQGKRVHAVP